MNKSAAQLVKAKQHLQQGDLVSAEKLVGKVVKKERNNLEAWFLLGTVKGGLGVHSQARDAFQQVLRINPKVAEAYCNIGLSYMQEQMWHEAIAPLKQAVALAPQYQNALSALSEVMDKEGDAVGALSYAKQWLHLNPASPQALIRVAILAQGMEDYAQARVCYQQAIDQGINEYSIYLNYGVAEQMAREFEHAIALFEKALKINPHCAVTTYNMASCCYALGEYEKGAVLCEKALELDPSLHRARAMILLNLNYQLPFDPVRVCQRHKAIAEQMVSGEENIHTNDRDPDRRLKVGYVSDGFHNNPVAIFMQPLLANHDHEQFEIFCYADVPAPDEVSVALAGDVDHWCNVSAMDDEAFYQCIRQDEVDILVDLDGYLNPHFTRFTHQLAPIQVSYLGYPCTTGMPTIQYRLTDELVDPQEEGDSHYSEVLLRLGNNFFCYQPPKNAPDVLPLPALEKGCITFGSFNKWQKLNHEVLSLWAEVLMALPSSRLLMQNQLVTSEVGQNKVRMLFSKLGVTEDRLVFLPFGSMNDYLLAHHQVDMMLDSFPWNGHTNTCHALWMGVPTLTLKGNHFSGRFGYEIMHSIDCDAYVTENSAGYVARAVELAQDMASLAALRGDLRQKLLDSPLCDGKGLAERVEGHYRDIWRKWCDQA